MGLVSCRGTCHSGGVRLSRRVADDPMNALSIRRAELVAAGIELTDLSDTNPTRHGLFDVGLLNVLETHVAQASRYEPSPRGPWPARAALAERFGGDPEDYWLTASTSEAYGWLFAMLGDSGDAVAVPRPGYPLIEPLARLSGLSVRGYRTFYVHPSGWEVDIDSLREVLSDGRVRAVVAVHPNNPTGAYVDETVAEVAAEYEVPLIADEVFYPFYLGDSVPPPRLSGVGESVRFGLDGLSKRLGAPQMKLGWIRLSGAASYTESCERALDVIADTYLSVNTPIALALPDLLCHADRSVSLITTRLKENLDHARQVFGENRVRTTYGGWMMLLDIPASMDADTMCIQLMERAGLYVHPAYFYDLPDSTLAISLLPKKEVFEEACQRLAAAQYVFAHELLGDI